MFHVNKSKKEDGCDGTGRYAAEHWICYHPSVMFFAKRKSNHEQDVQ